jgi:hypothetical protein
MGRWLPSQDPMMRAIGVEAGGGGEDDRSRVVAGCCPRVIDRSFFPSLEQGRLEAPNPSCCLGILDGVPLTLVGALEVSRPVIMPRGPSIFSLR